MPGTIGSAVQAAGAWAQRSFFGVEVGLVRLVVGAVVVVVEAFGAVLEAFKTRPDSGMLVCCRWWRFLKLRLLQMSKRIDFWRRSLDSLSNE